MKFAFSNFLNSLSLLDICSGSSPWNHLLDYFSLKWFYKEQDYRIFPVQCWLESLGQNCTRFLPVLYCPKDTVQKRYQPPLPHFKTIPPFLRSPFPFLQIPHPPTLLAYRSSQALLINRNATVKLIYTSIMHVKQQNSVTHKKINHV